MVHIKKGKKNLKRKKKREKIPREETGKGQGKRGKWWNWRNPRCQGDVVTPTSMQHPFVQGTSQLLLQCLHLSAWGAQLVLPRSEDPGSDSTGALWVVMDRMGGQSAHLPPPLRSPAPSPGGLASLSVTVVCGSSLSCLPSWLPSSFLASPPNHHLQVKPYFLVCFSRPRHYFPSFSAQFLIFIEV